MSFDFEDFLGIGKAIESFSNSLSQPLIKLIDTIAEYWRFKRVNTFTQEHKDALRSLDCQTPTFTIKAEFNSPINSAQEAKEYVQDAFEMHGKQVIQQQVNIDKVVINAAATLQSEQLVSPEPVNEDWLSNFWEHAKLANSEYMQKLWGKVLAGEVKKPGSYSLRAVHTLQIMSKRNAEVFSKISSLLLCGSLGHYMILMDSDYLKTQFNITDEDVMELIELGLLERPNTFQKPRLLTTDNKDTVMFTYYDKLVFIYQRPNDLESALASISHLNLTRLGVEFLSLIPPSQMQNEYINVIKHHFCERIKQVRRGECVLHMADILEEIKIEGERTGRKIKPSQLEKLY